VWVMHIQNGYLAAPRGATPASTERGVRHNAVQPTGWELAPELLGNNAAADLQAGGPARVASGGSE
jgi:hypothetical protein